jgi:hypothetical protein
MLAEIHFEFLDFPNLKLKVKSRARQLLEAWQELKGFSKSSKNYTAGGNYSLTTLILQYQ